MNTLKYLPLALVVLTLTTSCNKGNNPTIPANTKVTGSWELRRTSGTIVGFDSSFAPGNGRSISFSGTTYQRFAGSTPTASGTYQIIQDTAYLTGKVEDLIIFDNNAQIRTIANVSNDTLYLRQDVSDGLNSVYKRQAQ